MLINDVALHLLLEIMCHFGNVKACMYTGHGYIGAFSGKLVVRTATIVA